MKKNSKNKKETFTLRRPLVKKIKAIIKGFVV